MVVESAAHERLVAIAEELRGLSVERDLYYAAALVCEAIEAGALSAPKFNRVRYEAEAARTVTDEPRMIRLGSRASANPPTRQHQKYGDKRALEAAIWWLQQMPDHRDRLASAMDVWYGAGNAAWYRAGLDLLAELFEHEGVNSASPVAVDLIDDATDQICVHTDDFGSVNWRGTPYTFTDNQRIAVRVLWEHWEKGLAASVTAIGKEIDHAIYGDDSNARLRLSAVFRTKRRPHPAWGTMIVEAGQGLYRLVPARTKDCP